MNEQEVQQKKAWSYLRAFFLISFYFFLLLGRPPILISQQNGDSDKQKDQDAEDNNKIGIPGLRFKWNNRF
jgi:hypothetical protein